MADFSDLRFKRLIGRVDDKVRVGIVLLVILLAILVPWLSWSMHRDVPGPNFQDLARARSAAILQLDVNIAALLGSYRADAVADAVSMAGQYLDFHRDAALGHRRVAYHQAAVLACSLALSGLVNSVPPVLADLAQDEIVTVRVDGNQRAVEARCGNRLRASSLSSDVLLRTTEPAVIVSWLQSSGLLSETGCSFCTRAQTLELDAVTDVVTQLTQEEARLIGNAIDYLSTLADGPSLDFLASENYEWLIHLTAISWIGVIIATYANLVVSINDRTPIGLIAVYTMIRFVTAPIIAVVLVASINYGLTNEPMALNHSPLFLLFAFASGYMSESFNLMLRQGLNKLVPSFGLNAENMKGAADLQEATDRILKLPNPSLKPPSSVAELEERLHSDIDGGVLETEARVVRSTTY